MAARNVLLDDNFNCKLSDFSLANDVCADGELELGNYCLINLTI